MTTEPYYEDRRGRTRKLALVVGLAAAGLSLAGLALNMDQFFKSYHWAYLFWWEVSVGALGLGLLYQMTGGQWGYLTRPFTDAALRTLPLMALLFVPVAASLQTQYIFPWTETNHFAGDHHAGFKAWWLTPGFFLLRAVVYFAVWLLFAWLVTRFSPRGGAIPRAAHETPMGKLAGIGESLVVLTATFAALDWSMSIDTSFYSTIYGAIHAIGGLLAALALVTASTCWYFAAGSPTWDGEDHPAAPVLNDLGNLLLAFTMVFTYFHFSQFLIIWSGNLPEEAAWYVRRAGGWWELLGAALVFLQWAIPFACLLSRDLKRNPRRLGLVAVWVFLAHVPVVFWTVVPNFESYRKGPGVSWLDPVAVVAIGGPWLAAYCWLLRGRGEPTLPRPAATMVEMQMGDDAHVPRAT